MKRVFDFNISPSKQDKEKRKQKQTHLKTILITAKQVSHLLNINREMELRIEDEEANFVTHNIKIIPNIFRRLKLMQDWKFTYTNAPRKGNYWRVSNINNYSISIELIWTCVCRHQFQTVNSNCNQYK